MEKLFMQRMGAIESKRTAPDTKQAKPSSEKLQALENELRTDTMQAKEQQNNQAATGQGGQYGTDGQRRMQMKYDPQDMTYQLYGNHIGDFSSMLKQMTTDTQGATDAMQLSTLASKSEIVRLEDENEQWAMITAQFGLTSRSDKVLKLARKTSKLDSGLGW
jgi:hypothetical protein